MILKTAVGMIFQKSPGLKQIAIRAGRDEALPQIAMPLGLVTLNLHNCRLITEEPVAQRLKLSHRVHKVFFLECFPWRATGGAGNWCIAKHGNGCLGVVWLSRALPLSNHCWILF